MENTQKKEVEAVEPEATYEPGTALITAEEINPAVVFTAEGIRPIIDRIKAVAQAHVPDISTAQGRQKTIKLAYQVTRSKTLLDDMRKKHTAAIREQITAANAAGKMAVEELSETSTKVRLPVTEWEAEQVKIKEEAERIEQERILDITIRINTNFALDTIQGLEDKPSVMIQARIQRVTAIEILAKDYQEYVTEAVNAKNLLLAHLNTLYSTKAQQEEADRIQKEQNQIREAEDALRKKEDERLEAERKKLAEDKAAFEKQQADAKKEREDREKAEEEKREADAKAQREAEEEEAAQVEPKPVEPGQAGGLEQPKQDSTSEVVDSLISKVEPDFTADIDKNALMAFAMLVRGFIQDNEPSDIQGENERLALDTTTGSLHQACDRLIAYCE